MTRLARLFVLLLSLTGLGAWSEDAMAIAKFARATGNWSAIAWSSVSCGSAGATPVPTNADDVTICNGVTVTVNVAAVAGSVTIIGGATATALNLGVAGTSLTVTNAGGRSGNVVINGSSANVTRSLAVGARSLTVTGSVTINGGSTTGGGSNISQLSVTTGTADIGSLVINGGTVNTSVARATVTTGTINVTGDVTLTGGTVNSRDALLSVTGAGGVGTGINIGGTLNINATVATSSTVSITVSGGRITVNGAGGVNNGDTVTVGAGIFTVSDPTATYTNSSATNAVTTSISTGTLDVAGNLTNAAGETISFSSNGNLNVGGNFTNNGTFTRSTSTVTFDGAAAADQNLGGTAATIFNNLIINSAFNVIITSASAALSPTVNGVFTLTSGKVITTIGTNDIGLGTAATVSGGSATSYVQGAVQKNYAAAGTLTFPVGDATNYTPVVIAGTAGFTAGSLTISTTGGGDHPSIGFSGIDATKSVNRYWTVTAAGLSAGSTYTATFNYINGTPVDIDPGATPVNFIVEQWDGTTWLPTTLAGSCTPTPPANLCEQITGETGSGDFAIGEPRPGFNSNPGSFNAFETTVSATQILGRIYTKLAGASFTLSIVAVSNNARNTAPPANRQLTVEIINSTGTPGTFSAATNCWSGWSSVQSQIVATPVGWISGRVDVTINAPAQAVSNARIRVTQAGTGLIGCSTDRFSVRPAAFTGLSSTAAGNSGSSGSPFVKTGANFDLSVSSVAGYDGTPSIDSTKLVGSPNAGTLGGAFGVADGLTGVATGAGFFYSEAGNFSLDVNGIFDNSFTAVDQPGDCTNDFSNTPVGGQYGCQFGNTAVTTTIGRFTPDNFAFSLNAPQFTTACATGSFSYVGQPLVYATAPVITVQARNGTNNGLTNAITRNYTGSWWKLSNASLTYPAGTARGYAALTGTLDISGLPATDPVVADTGGGSSGTGTLTFGSGSGLLFTRTTPVTPFNAEIGLSINIIDADNVAAANPVAVGAATAGNGIAFSNGKEQRFGRLRLQNANGSQLISMPIPMQAQYWTGGGFVINTADNCTTISAGNIVIGNAQPAGFSLVSAPAVGGVFVAGVGSLRLSKSTGGARGSVDVSVNLTGGTAGASCTAGMPASTGSGLTWLQGLWCTPPGTYTSDATARATFGTYRNTDQFIYQQENY